MRSTRWRRTRRFRQEVCREQGSEKPKDTKEEYIETMWKSFGKTGVFATTTLQKRTIMQTEIENKNPDVKFNLEALVGSLVQNSIRRFSDSISCSGTDDQSQATATSLNMEKTHRQKV